MDLSPKDMLLKANAAVSAGDNEGFLFFCTEDVVWEFVGDRTLRGKEAVRAYMAEVYVEPPQFAVENIIAEGDLVAVTGKISLKDADGNIKDYTYCDVWRSRDGKLASLQAFVI